MFCTHDLPVVDCVGRAPYPVYAYDFPLQPGLIFCRSPARALVGLHLRMQSLNRMPDAQRWQIRHSFLGVLSEAGRRRCSLVSCLRSGRVVLRMRVSLPSSDIQTYRLHSSDVSEDLRRDYEISWWKTCREVSSLGKIFVTLLSNAFREETPPRIIWRREAKF